VVELSFPFLTGRLPRKLGRKPEEKPGREFRTDLESPSLSLQEVANEIGISHNGIICQIKKLKKEEILEWVEPDKCGGKVLKEERE
jgi:predicted HTH transcriptional regulator